MKQAILVFCFLAIVSLTSCIPLAIGGFIGYEMGKDQQQMHDEMMRRDR